jgi:hypothetical protein
MKLQWGLIASAAIELAILVNLIVLDVIIFSPKQKLPSLTLPSQSECGEECRQEIQESVQAAINALPPASPTVIQKTTTTRQTSSSVKEYFIPFGSGSTQNNQWEDIPGVEAYIDTKSYAQIQTVYFEVSMGIPTKNGVVSARLYNVTDQHPVWFSEVSTDSDTSKLVTTQIKLDPGNKQYRVQMKTTLSYTSVLDFARVKIITK